MDEWHVEPVTMPWHKPSIPCACGSEHGCYVEINIPPALGGLVLAGLKNPSSDPPVPPCHSARQVSPGGKQTKSDATTLPCDRQALRVPPRSKTLSPLSDTSEAPGSTRPVLFRRAELWIQEPPPKSRHTPRQKRKGDRPLPRVPWPRWFRPAVSA